MLLLAVCLCLSGGLAAGEAAWPLSVIQALLEKVGGELRQMDLDVMATPYICYEFFLGSLELREARLGNLSRLELEPGVEQEVQFEQHPGQYRYNLSLVLREPFLRFGFNYSLTPWVQGSGQLSLTGNGLQLGVAGSYTPGRKRVCRARLEALRLRGLGDFALTLAPPSALRSLVSYLGELGLRHSAVWLQEAFDRLLSGSRESAVVQDIYRTLLCG